MALNRRRYDDDDGRTIADMSGVERPSLMGHLGDAAGSGPEGRAGRHSASGENPLRPEHSAAGMDFTPEERRFAIWHALKAGLAIGSVYLVALIVLVLFLLLIWGQLF